MSHYEEGKEYFLKAKIAEIGHDGQYPLRILVPVNTPLTSDYTSINMANVPGLLLTAEEVASGVKDAMHRELAKTNAALSNEIGKQNINIVNLERTVEELRKKNAELTEWYKEANKTASEAAEANEVLKNQKKGLEKTIERHEMTIEERTIECNRWEGMYDKASKRCDELQKTCEEDTTVAIDLANQRDNLKRKYEAALKDLAQKDEACEKLKRQWDEALKDKDDLQKAVEGLNKDIDGYRATIQKMASVIGFLCGTEGGQNGL